jgi:hypothetical protein
MPTWKVFVTVIFAFVCLGLAFSVIVVPMTEGAGDHWVLWTLGLLVATAIAGVLFTLFLRSCDRSFGK